MVQLDEIHHQLVLEIQEGLAIAASGAGANAISDTFKNLSRHLQALAICHLLEFADQDEFRNNLVRSAHARRSYLRKSRDQQNADDHNLALSRTEAFFDALAAGDARLAREIADLSVSTWNADWEYEDDFCYFLFLHEVVRAPELPDEQRLNSTLNQFEKALEGAESPRLNVCSALLARDTKAFSDKFEALLDSIRNLNDKKRELVESYELTFWPRSFVSIEALALLRIAAMTGIAVDPGPFVLCPALARLPEHTEPESGLFEEIDRRVAAGSV